MTLKKKVLYVILTSLHLTTWCPSRNWGSQINLENSIPQYLVPLQKLKKNYFYWKHELDKPQGADTHHDPFWCWKWKASTVGGMRCTSATKKSQVTPSNVLSDLQMTIKSWIICVTIEYFSVEVPLWSSFDNSKSGILILTLQFLGKINKKCCFSRTWFL